MSTAAPHRRSTTARVGLGITLALLAVITVLALTFRQEGHLDTAPAIMKGDNVNQLVLAEGTLAYDDQGEGPLVVMVPGLGDLRQEYRFLTPELVNAGYRVVTVDLRGHGDSSTKWPSYGSEAVGQDLLALIRHLDTGPATVIGNSFGAGPAVWAAAEEQNLISGVVLIGPFVRDHDSSFMQQAMIRALVSGPWKVHAWEWYYGTLFPTRKPADFDAYRAALRANLAEPGRFAAVKAMISRSDAAIEARLPSVDVPSLVLMGTKDPDFPDPEAEARWIADRLRGDVELVEGAGHYPQTEMPEITAPMISDFLDKVHGKGPESGA